MPAFQTIAIIYPVPDKVDRVRELMATQIKHVHEKEPYTQRYLLTEQVDATTPEIVMIETYESKEAHGKHIEEQHFKDLFAALSGENLSAKAPYIVHTEAKQGFDLDRKLV